MLLDILDDLQILFEGSYAGVAFKRPNLDSRPDLLLKRKPENILHLDLSLASIDAAKINIYDTNINYKIEF